MVATIDRRMELRESGAENLRARAINIVCDSGAILSFSATFDTGRLEFSGEAIPVAEGIRRTAHVRKLYKES